MPVKDVQNGKSFIKMQNQNLRHIKRLDNNYQSANLVQTFPYFINNGYNLVL